MLEAAFYGDDFTGSTDALMQFERCGLRAVLLVDLPPTDELRDLATQYDVIGVAGIARSLAPDEQEAEIRPILTALRDLKPRVVQYKICSTADSSPQLGSIGRALEVGRSVFGPAVVPVLAAQPELGRYTVFSHHFAAEAGAIHRLDRQPTMANHPATPMTEADLRVHLAAQTDLQIGALHLTSYADLPDRYPQSYADLPDDRARSSDDVVVLDALTDSDLRLLGRMLVASSNGRPLFAIGSGGLSRALAMNLTPAAPSTRPYPPSDAASTTPTVRHWPASAHRSSEHAPDSPQVLVVSGSQSSRTREQIAYAVSAGWLAVELRDPTTAHRAAVAALRDGAPGVVIHTGVVVRTGKSTEPAEQTEPALHPGRHSDHPAYEPDQLHSPAHDLVGSLGDALAAVVREVVRDTGVRRLIVAGGDTSGRIVRNLGATTLELLPTPDHLGPGTALCQASSPDSTVNGLHVLLKGGQIGLPTLFETFRTT